MPTRRIHLRSQSVAVLCGWVLLAVSACTPSPPKPPPSAEQQGPRVPEQELTVDLASTSPPDTPAEKTAESAPSPERASVPPAEKPEAPRPEPAPSPPAPSQLSGEEKLQQEIRQMTAGWLRDGTIQSMMAEAKIPLDGTLVPIQGVRRLGTAILMASRIPSETASNTCRETALAQALEAVAAVREHYATLTRRHLDLKASPQFVGLRDAAIAGFDDLSNANVFLDQDAIARLARETISNKYGNEPDLVRTRLTEDLERHMSAAAESARKEFRLYVRFIFFGTHFGDHRFGESEAFLIHRDQESRRKAIEEALYGMIRSHPKYQKAKTEHDSVKNVVAKHARDLAETIHNR